MVTRRSTRRWSASRTEEQKTQIAKHEAEVQQHRRQIAELISKIDYAEPQEPAEAAPAKPVEFVWIEDSHPEAKSQGGWEFVGRPAPVFSGEKSSKRTAKGLSQHFFEAAKKPLSVSARRCAVRPRVSRSQESAKADHVAME